MPGRRNLRSPFRSITEIDFALALGVAAAASACGPGTTCGTDKAPTYGLMASGNAVSLLYGAFSASANNDCPMPGAPSGVVSLTLEGSQMGGGGIMTICVPRPDLLASEELAIGASVQIIDFTGTASDCDYMLDPASTPSGSAKGIDECNNGTNKNGFALEVTGSATLIQECNGTSNNVVVSLSGTTAVTAAAQ
jgi:hypothetical protein